MRPSGNPYWAHFAIVAFLLTWGVVTRRRENIQRRAGLGVLAAFGWVVALGYVLLNPRRMDDAEFRLEFWSALLQAASLTTGCVLFELIAPRSDRIPPAIVHPRDD